jgi:hypothetical protein
MAKISDLNIFQTELSKHDKITKRSWHLMFIILVEPIAHFTGQGICFLNFFGKNIILCSRTIENIRLELSDF